MKNKMFTFRGKCEANGIYSISQNKGKYLNRKYKSPCPKENFSLKITGINVNGSSAYTKKKKNKKENN